MRKFLLFFLFAAICNQGFTQDFSNKGKDFWVGYGYHQVMTAGNQQNMVLYFATDQVTTITITIPGTGYTQTLTSGATPTVLTSNPIPKIGLQDSRLLTETATPQNKGIHIISDKPIVAYAHIYNASVSGATILFPTNTLGKEYYSINYTNQSNSANSNCWMYVIAADTGTTIVEITPSVTTLTRPAGIPFQVTLTQGQVYNVMATYSGNSGGDLTGSTIRSISVGGVACKRIAVFSGSGRIHIKCNNPDNSISSDNYMVQAFPKSAWGKKYLTASTGGVNVNNIYRICVSDPTTIITLNGSSITYPLVNNFYYEVPATAVPQKIESDKPILVAQYIPSQGQCGNNSSPNNIGDPEVIYLSPVEQSISTVLWNAPSANAITQHYYNVVIKNQGSAISSFRFDGLTVPASSFTVHPFDANYSYIKQSVSAGSHVIQSDSGFNAIAYGYGQTESYGYNAGTNVRDLYQKIGVSSQYGIEAIPSVCTGSPFKFKISLPYQPDSMSWDFHNPATVPAIPNYNMPGPLVPDSITVINTRTVWWYSIPIFYTWNTVGTFPITITTHRQNNEGCGNIQEIEFDLEVSDPPIAAIAAPDSVCHGQNVQFTDATVSVKPTYHWWWSFGDPASGVNNTSNLQNPQHTFSGPGTYTVRFSNITTPGCLSDTLTKVITVNSLPLADITGNITVCVNGPSPDITFTGSAGIAPYTFTYRINGGPIQTISSTGTNSTVTLPVPTTVAGLFSYTLVNVTDGSTTLCSSAQPDTVVVNVGPLPTASIAGTVTVCKNATSPDITFTGTNGAAPYTFTYNINGGASLTAVTTSGNTVTVPVSTTTAGTFVYNLLSVQGGSSAICSQNQSGSATVIVNELPTATVSGTTEVCLNGTPPVITFTGSGTTGPYTFVYSINSGGNQIITGNPATVTAPTIFAGTFTYNLISVTDATANACTQTQTGSSVITVNPLPTASFTSGLPSCQNRVISFTDASVANAGNITQWTWNFGDPASGSANTSTLQNPTHTFTNAGSYTVSLTIQTDKGCISSTPFTSTILINSRPVAGFIDPEVCLSDTWAQFTDTSTVANGTITSWFWNFDDPASGALNTSTLQNPQHSYSTTGPKNITLYATSNNGCVDTLLQTFIVNGDIPVADFNITSPTGTCGYDSLSIVNTSTINVGSIIKIDIYWDNAGAPTVFETDLNPFPNKVYKHLYPASQTTNTYTIRYKVYGGATCIDEKTAVVTVNAVPNVQFNPIPNTCLDVAPFQITQASETGGVTAGPAPVFSGPGVSSTGIFNPASVGPGTYMITYLFTSNMGCTDVDSQAIRVLAPPVAAFNTTGVVCQQQEVTFQDQSSTPAGVGVINQWTWNFDDGTSPVVLTNANPFTHIFQLPGVYNVQLTVRTTDGCLKSVTVPVTVGPKPVPDFAFSPSACLPNAVIQFNNQSTPGTYTWNFGDPASGTLNTSTALNPSHTYSSTGPFNVTLQVQSAAGCIQDTVLVVNTIHPRPTANFSTSLPSVCLGEPVSFQDLSNPADGTLSTWNWNFGDNTTSGTQNPVHQYNSADSFIVSLYITNSFGCRSDTMEKGFAVYNLPVVNLVDTIFVLEDGSATLTPEITDNTNDLTFLWTPSLYLNNNTIQNPVSTPDDDILYNVVVTARGGCKGSDVVFIKVLLGPMIPNTFTPNNDGRNDFWIIEHLKTYPNNRVQVFTRTGQLVFESRGYKTPWDGTIKGKTLPIDTYYYIIEPGNGRKPLTGYVTILK